MDGACWIQPRLVQHISSDDIGRHDQQSVKHPGGKNFKLHEHDEVYRYRRLQHGQLQRDLEQDDRTVLSLRADFGTNVSRKCAGLHRFTEWMRHVEHARIAHRYRRGLRRDRAADGLCSISE